MRTEDDNSNHYGGDHGRNKAFQQVRTVTGDVVDIVADEVGKFIAEYYATGTNTTMYDITKNRTTDYDRKQLRIQEIERRLPTIENEEPNGEQLE